MDQLEMDFIKGFNNGYLLAKHEPELAEKLIKTPINDNQYLKGLGFGKQEYDNERTHDRLKNSKDNTISKSDKDIERER